jgi:hypothetical protein
MGGDMTETPSNSYHLTPSEFKALSIAFEILPGEEKDKIVFSGPIRDANGGLLLGDRNGAIIFLINRKLREFGITGDLSSTADLAQGSAEYTLNYSVHLPDNFKFEAFIDTIHNLTQAEIDKLMIRRELYLTTSNEEPDLSQKDKELFDKILTKIDIIADAGNFTKRDMDMETAIYVLQDLAQQGDYLENHAKYGTDMKVLDVELKALLEQLELKAAQAEKNKGIIKQ